MCAYKPFYWPLTSCPFMAKSNMSKAALACAYKVTLTFHEFCSCFKRILPVVWASSVFLDRDSREKDLRQPNPSMTADFVTYFSTDSAEKKEVATLHPFYSDGGCQCRIFPFTFGHGALNNSPLSLQIIVILSLFWFIKVRHQTSY